MTGTIGPRKTGRSAEENSSIFSGRFSEDFTFDEETGDGRRHISEILCQAGVIAVMFASNGIESKFNKTIQRQLTDIDRDAVDRLKTRKFVAEFRSIRSFYLDGRSIGQQPFQLDVLC